MRRCTAYNQHFSKKSELLLEEKLVKLKQTSGGSNLSGIAQYNERLILQLIRRSGSLTKAEISRLTQLSAQTASVIINRLLDDELLYKQERRYEIGKVGQPAIPIALNPEGAYSIGVKIGRRGVDLVLINFTGVILQRINHIYDYPDPDFIFPTIKQGISDLIATLNPVQHRRLLGIGIAAPYGLGGWQQEADIPSSITEHWNSLDIKEAVQAHQPYPVWLVNDATAACIASLEFGNPERFNNYLHIFVGTFIGGGIIMNRTLYLGSFNNAGAIGSMPLPSSYAHTEANGSTVQLINCASRYLLNNTFEAHQLDPNLEVELLAEDEAANNSLSRDIFQAWAQQAAAAIAYAVVASASLIDFEGVIIDGLLPPRLTKHLTDTVQTEMEKLDIEGLILPKLSAGTIGNDARALGGAFLPFYTNFAPDRSILISSEDNIFQAF